MPTTWRQMMSGLHKAFYVTYGHGTNLRDNFSVVEAVDYDAARVIVFNTIGAKFAFMYDESQWVEEGTSQAAYYGLTEVPLQAQVPVDPNAWAFNNGLESF
jgi:hypothetical protein